MLVDFELLFFLCTGQPLDHGVWHSYLFVLTIYPIATSLAVYSIERRFGKALVHVYRVFRLFPRSVSYSFRSIYFCCLIGGASHMFLDMLTHETSHYVLFPLDSGNPLWIGGWDIVVLVPVILLSLYSVLLWFRQMKTHGTE